MINNILNIRNLTGVFLVLISCGLSFRELKEPDLWWQLRTGEWMLENGKVTMEDVFSFTHEGVEWINVKWGFEVMYAWLARIGGPEIVLLLQALVLIGILALLGNVIRFHAQRSGKELKDGMVSMALLLFLVICGFRFNARPEMCSHLMMAAYIFVFVRSSKTPLLLWSLIPLQVLWTNLHEAYGMGVVLMCMFVFGGVIDQKLTGRKFEIKALVPIIVAIASIALNPRGTELYLHPLNIFSQLGENQFTTELYGWTEKSYYDFAGIGALITAAFVLVTVLRTPKGKTSKLKAILNTHGGLWILLTVAFIVLGLKSHRNIPFMMIALVPMVARNAVTVVKAEKTNLVIAICLLSVMMIATPTNTYYDITGQHQTFGFRVSKEQTPVGAANFLKQQNIRGKGFTDYFSSSYLLWALQPDFKTYLDLRDLDIFPAEFMNNVQQSYLTPDARLATGQNLWQFLDSLDRFDYVVLLNSENFMNLNRYLLHQDPSFELVYADPLSSVFVRKDGLNTNLVPELGVANGTRNVFHQYAELTPPGYSEELTKVVHPGYKYEETQNQELTQLMNSYYQQMGLPQLVNQHQPLPPS